MRYILSLLSLLFFIFYFFFYPFNFGAYKYNFIDSISVSENTQKNKDINNYRFDKRIVKQMTILIKLNQVIDNTYYIEIFDNANNFKYSNIKYDIRDNSVIIKIDKNTPKKIFLTYTNKKIYLVPKIYSETEYTYLYLHKELLYGLCYGIMFCSFLYYGIMFYSTRDKLFLYYSLMQCFAISTLSIFAFMYGREGFTSYQQILLDILENLTFIFTLLFAQKVLEIKNNHKYINIFLNVLIYLHVIDIFLIFIFEESILYSYVNLSLAFLIPVFLASYVYLRGNKSVLIYLFGWLIILMSIFLSDYNISILDATFMLHIGMTIESLFLSFALGIRLNKIIKDKNENEKLLIHNSKLSSTGEMIHNISHQWKQPLTQISFIAMDVALSNDENDLSKGYLTKKINELKYQINFMANTIDTFSDFYKKENSKEYFFIKESIAEAILIIKSDIQRFNIQVNVELIKDKRINALKNEYAQVILNILNNSKDAFIKNNIDNPIININIDCKDDKSIVNITDNAGGIKESNLNKVFNPYFTSKEKGSGIGLYMSNMIIKKHFNGSITVKNERDGVCFTIIV